MQKWLSYTNTTITSSVGCASFGVKSLAPCSMAWASPVRCESTQQNLGELYGFAVKVCFRFGRPWVDSCDQNSVAWWHVLLGKADLSPGSHLSSRKETFLVEGKCNIYQEVKEWSLPPSANRGRNEDRNQKLISAWLFTEGFWESLWWFYSTP